MTQAEARDEVAREVKRLGGAAQWLDEAVNHRASVMQIDERRGRGGGRGRR